MRATEEDNRINIMRFLSCSNEATIHSLDTLRAPQYRSVHMGAAEEIVAIVDENNTVVGSAPRKEMRAKALPHRATYVLVFNSRGQLYVQKRTLTKMSFPVITTGRGWGRAGGRRIRAGRSP